MGSALSGSVCLNLFDFWQSRVSGEQKRFPASPVGVLLWNSFIDFFFFFWFPSTFLDLFLCVVISKPRYTHYHAKVVFVPVRPPIENHAPLLEFRSVRNLVCPGPVYGLAF